jgi:hypothetical protein
MMLLRPIPLLLSGLLVLSAAAQDAAPAAAPSPVAAPVAEPAVTNALAVTSTNAPVAVDTNAPVAAVTNAVISVEPTAEDLIVRSNLNAAIRSSARTSPSVAGIGTNAGKASNGTNTVGRFDYTSFRIIEDRNIFDPTRRPRQIRDPRNTQPVHRSQFFGLVGTISYEKGSFAFFDGSSSEYRKALKPEDTIAGYKVAEIGTDKVKLESAGKAVELHVGSQMRKEEAGEWTVSTRTDTQATTPSADAAGDGEKTETTNETSTGSGVLDDAIQRLLKRRQEEENK